MLVSSKSAGEKAAGRTKTMFEFMQEEERGQVGIGTLIVFIAMVLVAAIAAGVLINTAGFLQTQAEATGEESTQQVSDRLQVVSQSGTVDTADNQIPELEFVVSQSPGADNIDLNEVTVELIGDQGQETFKIDDENAAAINIFTDDNGDGVLTDNSDRAEVTLTLENTDVTEDPALGGYDSLDEGESLTVTFTAPSGASTTTEIRVPTTLTDDQSSVRL